MAALAGATKLIEDVQLVRCVERETVPLNSVRYCSSGLTARDHRDRRDVAGAPRRVNCNAAVDPIAATLIGNVNLAHLVDGDGERVAILALSVPRVFLFDARDGRLGSIAASSIDRNGVGHLAIGGSVHHVNLPARIERDAGWRKDVIGGRYCCGWCDISVIAGLKNDDAVRIRIRNVNNVE